LVSGAFQDAMPSKCLLAAEYVEILSEGSRSQLDQTNRGSRRLPGIMNATFFKQRESLGSKRLAQDTRQWVLE
jgi:hypothetical protein